MVIRPFNDLAMSQEIIFHYPIMVTIQDNETGLILFMGRGMDPTK